MSTKIEWCDETINPIQDKIKGKSGRGYHCTKVSPGCDHCYAESMNKRFGNGLPFDARKAEFELVQSELEKPLRWKKPKRIFVQSMGDLFHKDITNEFIDRVFVMMLHPMLGMNHHTYIILTKRPERILTGHPKHYAQWKNIWLGVTAENQAQADKRIPVLLQIPAAVRFVSMEPMLGPVDLILIKRLTIRNGMVAEGDGLDWVICGGESGPGARPMQIQWARDLLAQCRAAGVPFFMKQIDKKTPIPDDLMVREYPK